MDYTKFLKVKNQLQKFYNFIAKEEREIIYSCKINEESSIKESITPSSKDQELQSGEDLVALTHKKGDFYLEFLKIQNKEISFKNSSNIKFLSRLFLKNETQVQFRVSEQNYEITIYDKLNMNELIWVVIRILRLLKINQQAQIKGINFKDLDDLADKNNFHLFNPLLEELKSK